MSTMRIVIVSDTHGCTGFDVPEGDVLVHCGDFTMYSKGEEIIAFDRGLAKRPHKYKIVIAGNHEAAFEESPALAQRLLTDPIYLEDSAIRIDGVKFYGSPWQPWFFDCAFNFAQGRKGREQARETWSRIPNDTDVLITHGPPYGLLDRTGIREHAGCKDLLARVRTVKPALHAFGHIHTGFGHQRRGETLYVNAAICDSNYVPRQPARVVDLIHGTATLVQSARS
jgi:Icc-related predicted phosphoesterase